MTDATASEQPPEAQAHARPRPASAAIAGGEGTAVAIRLLYLLGILSAVVLAGSLIVIAIEAVASGGNGVEVHVSTPALVAWVALIAAAAGTFVWRRRGRGK